jgi:hypothetical protein
VGLFRRKRDETLNEQLLREAGYDATGRSAPLTQSVGEPPAPWQVGPPGPADPRAGPFGRSLPSERPSEWDVTVLLEDPDLAAARYEFSVLPDGSLIVGDDCDEDLSRLADAVERELDPPYRAVAVHYGDERWWMVSACALTVLELEIDGEELELSDLSGRRQYIVDGAPHDPWTASPDLVALGQKHGVDYAVQGKRLDGNSWSVTASAL